SPKTALSSSNAPLITARKTCHSLLTKLMSVLLLHSFCRINAILADPCVCLAITNKQNRIAVKWMDAI
ncbi:MAG: hypothetical protein ACXW1U_21110, partial [Methylobacter sp.]